MTLYEIYLMVKEGILQNDPIPAGILADMLEDIGMKSSLTKNLRIEETFYKDPRFRFTSALKTWDHLYWIAVTIDGKKYWLNNLAFWGKDSSVLYLTVCHPQK